MLLCFHAFMHLGEFNVFLSLLVYVCRNRCMLDYVCMYSTCMNVSPLLCMYVYVCAVIICLSIVFATISELRYIYAYLSICGGNHFCVKLC